MSREEAPGLPLEEEEEEEEGRGRCKGDRLVVVVRECMYMSRPIALWVAFRAVC